MLHNVGNQPESNSGVAHSNVSEMDMLGLKMTTEEVFMPSGFTCIIRESSGEDEDIMTRAEYVTNGTAMFQYLASIIVSCEGYAEITAEIISQWKVRDIYYLLFKSRILNHGKDVYFDYKFESGPAVRFIEDLSRYDDNLRKPCKNPHKEQIRLYNLEGDKITGRTSSGKNFRFRMLTGKDEIAFMGKNRATLSINDKLRVRDFELQLSNGVWQIVERFNILKAKDCTEIRKIMDELDPDFLVMCELVNPQNQSTESVSLLSVDGFFFPRS